MKKLEITLPDGLHDWLTRQKDWMSVVIMALIQYRHGRGNEKRN